MTKTQEIDQAANTNRRHPRSTFFAQYPYNQGTITRSGHEIHFNDTPNNESIRIAHTKGTYFEIESTGRWIQTIVENAYYYIKKSYTLTIDGHCDIKIKGAYTFNSDASSLIVVKEDQVQTIGQNSIEAVGGTKEIHTEGDHFEKINGNQTIAVKGNANFAVEGSQVESVSGTKDQVIETTFRIKCNTLLVEADDIIYMKCSKFVLDAGQIEIHSATTTKMKSGGITYIDGSQIRLND
jgi:hypothetical protein